MKFKSDEIRAAIDCLDSGEYTGANGQAYYYQSPHSLAGSALAARPFGEISFVFLTTLHNYDFGITPFFEGNLPSFENHFKISIDGEQVRFTDDTKNIEEAKLRPLIEAAIEAFAAQVAQAVAARKEARQALLAQFK
jgi:hypothetical protein